MEVGASMVASPSLRRVSGESAISWSAVFGGAAAAAALSLILLALGAGLGLSSVSPWSYRSSSGSTIAAGSIIWLLVTSLCASGLGGYIAGATRAKWEVATERETHFRDTVHGLLAWSVATLMVIKADPTKVKAGHVTLEAVNRSKDLVHEVLVVPAPSDGKELPYNTKTSTIIEKRVHSLGEISELKPGARGKLTLNLKAGTYLLLCNQPGHYKAGMSTKLVVER